MPLLPENPPLSLLEGRVLGCLIEKEFSTPDVYPLSMNALVNACNQKNNRTPVLQVGPREVEAATDQLRQRRLVVLFSGADARVPKFRQILDTAHPLDAFARALVGELLLRGPQTAAALRANAERLCPIPEGLEVDAALEELAARPEAPLVCRLQRQPGQKEARWAQLFTGEADYAAAPEPVTVTVSLPPEVAARLEALEAEVSRLRGELNTLRESLGEA